jgi:hypothetical protein
VGAASVRKITVTADALSKCPPYLPLPFRGRAGLRWVRCGNIELHPPSQRERRTLLKWLERPEIFDAFGYAEPITRANLDGCWLPDLTLPDRFMRNERGYGEPVEFLVVGRRAGRRCTPIGLCIFYEHQGSGDPTQEVDFALPEAADQGSQATISQVQLCVFSYLFLICGAHCVTWRRRRASNRGREASSAAGRGQVGAADRVRITPAVAQRRLQRRGACKPMVCLQHPALPADTMRPC